MATRGRALPLRGSRHLRIVSCRATAAGECLLEWPVRRTFRAAVKSRSGVVGKHCGVEGQGTAEPDYRAAGLSVPPDTRACVSQAETLLGGIGSRFVVPHSDAIWGRHQACLALTDGPKLAAGRTPVGSRSGPTASSQNACSCRQFRRRNRRVLRAT